MPAYEATPDELQRYGVGLSIWQQIALLQANDRLIVELTQKNRDLLEDELIRLQRARQQILQYRKGLQ